MRGIVVYYSQTGNTKKIAHEIHQGMRQVIKECDIAELKEVDPQELTGYDLIGLGSPWWSKLPPNITAFVDGMAGLKGKHAFPFFTHSTLPAGSMQSIIPALEQKGLVVIGFNDWYGNSLQQFIPHPHITDGHPDSIDLKEAEDFGREMAQLSQRIYQGETQLIPELPTIEELDKIYGRKQPPPKEMVDAEIALQQRTKINTEKCQYPGCTLCVDNCPNDSIDFSVSPPVLKDSCVRCWFCEQICPEGAIEIDWEPFAKLHDRGFEILIEGAKRAEAEGRFRRLISLDDIGWDTHWYKVSGHPRVKIE